jgi:hypothetical protein
MFLTLLAHQVGPHLGLGPRGQFVVARLCLRRAIRAAVKAPGYLSRPICATRIGAMLVRREFGSSRRIPIMGTIRVNEL